MEPTFADAVMTLREEPNVLDIRTVGITAAIDLASIDGAAGKRGMAALDTAFHQTDIVLRVTGWTAALTPPLILSEDQIGEIVEKVARTIRSAA